jgi:spore germination protein YaaH
MKHFFTLFLSTTLLLNAQQEHFKSSHQRDWELYNQHPELVGTTVAPPSLAKRSDLTQAQILNNVVYGFHPYWQNGSESNYYFSLLTHLAYFSAEIDPSTGSFSTTRNWSTANVVTLAKQYGVKVHLCLTLFSSHSTLLSSTTAKNNLIQNTLTQLALRGADGVNIDFESMSESVRDNFRTFMKQFGDTLKARGYEFVIELPAVDWSTGSDGIGIFDATFFSTVNSVVDYYFAMLYDYWWSGSTTAGPNSPLQSSSVTSVWHVLRSINTHLSRGCPANKFIAGFPNYGHDWPVSSSTRMASTTGSASSRIYTVIKNNYIDTISASDQFVDATYNVPWYRYQSGGSWRQTWYDDSLSWAKKFDSIKTKNVAGTGMWALGYDGSEPEMWGAIKTAFASSPNIAHTSLDNFETNVGHFSNLPTYSGTTVGISTSSTSAWTNDAANNGWGSLQIVLKDNTSSTSDWTVRHLSGGGTPANNISFSTTGYLGFWMKTSSAPSTAQVALSVDDGAGGTLISSKQSVVSDGSWKLYEWNLAATTWTTLAGSDNILDGPTATLDAIMFYAPNGSPDWTLYIDDVSHNSAGPLPVELDRMNAFSTELNVHLQWNTATEVNNYGFEILRRSAPQNDSHSERSEESSIGFVQGNGTTSSPHSYSYTDRVSHPGTYKYRLRQIDRDGQFRYSPEMIVTISGYPEAYSLLQNFPNPFNPVTTIQFAIPDGMQNEHVQLKLYDALGREVAVLVDEVRSPGIYSVQFNGSSLASGVYFYTLRSGNFSATKKLMLVK